MEGRPADGLMRARGAILPGTKGGVPNLIRGAAQSRCGAGIDVGIPYPAPRGAGAVTKSIEIGIPNGLPRPAAPIRIEERGVADVGAGTGLGNRHTRKKKKEEKK